MKMRKSSMMTTAAAAVVGFTAIAAARVSSIKGEAYAADFASADAFSGSLLP
jgi:hypothetical protein